MLCCWPPSLSAKKPLGTPSALHLAILPLVQSSLHRWLPSSYAYLLIMLQGSFPPQGHLTGQRDDNTGKSNCTQMAHITGCFQESSNVELFFSGSTSSWLDLSVFFLFCFSDALSGLSELPLSELKCNIVQRVYRYATPRNVKYVS